jgi:very-short-patch-repair endonuclease
MSYKFYTYRSNLKRNAVRLRREMTPEERKLWYAFLRLQPQHFRRQKMIGCYIVDFYCAESKLVIEIDGSQHYYDDEQQDDIQRDNYLHSMGITVLRYSNLDINMNFRNVCEDIYSHLV